jgi:SAM-dependent methyltransferase
LIILSGDNVHGVFPSRFSYCHGWNLLTRLVLPITRHLRALNAERYLGAGVERLLDIGCGDGYFLKRSRAREKYGLDKLLGDRISDLDRFPASFFDCVTMLAVVEHLDDPEDILRHVLRVLKPGGRLVLTTPKKGAHLLIRLYVPGIGDEHKRYYDRASLCEVLSSDFTLEDDHTFLFGLNQAFSFVKKGAPGDARLEGRQAPPRVPVSSRAAGPLPAIHPSSRPARP